MTTLLLDATILRAEKARRSFALFVKEAWPELEPSTPLQWNWHIDALCFHLQALHERQITRLVIGIAPGHAKSTIVSQMFPVWCWINDPYSRWLCASHSLDLAIRDNRYRRRLIESEWFKTRYGHIFKFAPDQRVKSYYENDKKGYHMAVAVRGSGTGKRADVLLCLCYNVEVTTDKGRIKIGEIVEKQLPVRVLAFDHTANSACWQEIEKYEKNPDRPCVRVTLNDGRTIDTTADHPFYVVGRGYVPASQLTNTDEVITDESFLSNLRKRSQPQTLTETGVETLLVRCVEPLASPEYTYNLRVAEDHNFFANGVLVHNCDDPNNAMAGSADIAATVEWYGKTWVPRQNDQENGPSITVGQRLGANDLIGHILELGGCEHLCLPEEFESARRCRTSIGWTDPRTVEGELLWPAKFPARVLAKLKAVQGPIDYAAQYQQNPVPSGGEQFKEKWFRYCSVSVEGNNYTLETPEGVRHVVVQDCWRFTVVDLAVSTKQSADWTVIQTYDVTPQNELLLIDQIRGHFDNPTQQKLIRLTYFRLKPQFVQIETVAYQLALVQQLRDEPVEPHKLRPNPVQVGDFLVKVGSIEALDKTLSLVDIPSMKAHAVQYDGGEYVQYNGYGVVRVQGDIFFFRYMCEKQGYCEIVRDILAEDIKLIEQQEKQKYSIPIREYKPIRDKVSRASAPALLMENGKFYFLKTLPDLHVIKTEYLQFPKGAHDDMVDCGSQAAEVIFVPRGPVMWGIDDVPESRSPERMPVVGAAPVASLFDDSDDGEMFDMEVSDRW